MTQIQRSIFPSCTRRALVGIAASLAIAPAWAQGSAGYPAKPIRVIVPYAAGTVVDVVARTLGQELAEIGGQPVIVENKPGAGEVVAATTLLRSPADGYTLMLTLTPNVVADAVQSKLPYAGVTDFAAVAKVTTLSGVAVVGSHVQARNLREFTTLMRASPGKYTYGSSGVGSPMHLRGEWMTALLGTQAVHVPFRAFGPVVSEILAGRVDFAFLPMNQGLELAKGGQVRLLGVLTRERSKEHPEIPTLHEQGATGFESPVSHVVMAPKATPQDVIVRLNQMINRAIERESFRTKVMAMGGFSLPQPATPQEAAQLVASEEARWRKLIRDLKIQVE